MTPALAVRRVTAATDLTATAPVLIGRPRSGVIHVAATTTRRSARPWCGQRGKRWTIPANATRRRLCGRCARLVEARTPRVALDPTEVARELDRAATVAEVLALRSTVILVGPTAVVDGRRLHARYADAIMRARRALR